MTKRWSRFWYNPILVKEYQWRMRKRVTPWIVFFHLFFGGMLIFSLLFVSSLTDMKLFDLEWGTGFLVFFSFIQLMMVSFILPAITSGLISSEQERQTLPLLLTTTLSSSQIIFGKWFSSISFMLLLYVSTLPIYAVIYNFGGISLEHIVRVCLHLLVSMFFVGSVGIFFSTLVKRTVIATVLSYLVVMIWGVGSFIVFWILILFVEFQFVNEFFYTLHPVISMSFAFGDGSELFLKSLFIPNVGFPVYPVYLIIYTLLTVILLVCSAYFFSLKRT